MAAEEGRPGPPAKAREYCMRMPQELDDALRLAAYEDRTSKSQIIRTLVREWATKRAALRAASATDRKN